MNLLKSLSIALSTYSAVPMPQFKWEKENMTYAICFFPVVGIICGAILYGWLMLAQALNFSPTFFASVAVCLPLLVTGGIHMDGFMDTTDALSSHQSKERKLDIMKDPNAGAFAVIYFVLYMFLNFGLFYRLYKTGHFTAIIPIYLLSRALTAYTVVSYKSAKKTGMLLSFIQHTARQKAMIAIVFTVVIAGLTLIYLSQKIGLIILAFSLATLLFYHGLSSKQFGGVTGDTSGFFVQICELSCLIGAFIGTLLL